LKLIIEMNKENWNRLEDLHLHHRLKMDKTQEIMS